MISGIIIFAVEHDDTQQYRSGHNEHDWKSCVRQKRTESSNLSCCAKKDTTRKGGVFLRWEIRTGGERSEKTPLRGVCPPLCVSRHGSAASESLLLRQSLKLWILPGLQAFFIALLGDHCDRSKSIRKELDRVSAFYMSCLRRILRCEPCPLTAGGAASLPIECADTALLPSEHGTAAFLRKRCLPEE